MNLTKKELRQKENQERLSYTLNTLESIIKNHDIRRTTRNLVKEVSDALRDEKSGSIYVRASNAISILDSATQNRQMESYIRTTLWQVVSALESIRE
jgi:uncharacterized protein (UPF0147 family)